MAPEPWAGNEFVQRFNGRVVFKRCCCVSGHPPAIVLGVDAGPLDKEDLDHGRSWPGPVTEAGMVNIT